MSSIGCLDRVQFPITPFAARKDSSIVARRARGFACLKTAALGNATCSTAGRRNVSWDRQCGGVMRRRVFDWNRWPVFHTPSSFATKSFKNDQEKIPNDDIDTNIIGSLGLFALWAGLIGYAFLLAPNQTPLRDQYFLEKFLNLTDDGIPLNAIFSQLFYIMGIWPIIYTALLIPAAKSKNRVPAWPFVTLSYAFGAFALLPFMALWQSPSPPPELPPKKEELEGPRNLLNKGMESPIVAYLLLVGTLVCILQIVIGWSTGWSEYLRLLEESRLVHVSFVRK